MSICVESDLMDMPVTLRFNSMAMLIYLWNSESPLPFGFPVWAKHVIKPCIGWVIVRFVMVEVFPL